MIFWNTKWSLLPIVSIFWSRRCTKISGGNLLLSLTGFRRDGWWVVPRDDGKTDWVWQTDREREREHTQDERRLLNLRIPSLPNTSCLTKSVHAVSSPRHRSLLPKSSSLPPPRTDPLLLTARIVGWRSWPRSYCGRWFRRRRWTRRRCCATWWPTSRASRAPRPRYRWPSSGTASPTPPTASTPPRPAGGRPGATCSGRSRPGPSSSPRTPSSASTRSAPVPSPSSRHRSSSAERAPIRCASGCDLVGSRITHR